MKALNAKKLFSALALTAATVTFAPIANAAEIVTPSIQQRRLTFLENQTKAVEDIQATRLEFLENQTKAIDNIQKVRLEHLSTQTK
ncbi:MAG: hypothetical protein AAFQ74_09810, partial [Cyanobacteria bacterium J06623_4]